MSEYEEKLAAEALEASDLSGLSPSPEGDPQMAREFLEVSGLLGLQVEESAPRAELRSLILNRIRDEKGAGRLAAESAIPENVVAMPTREIMAPPPAGPQWSAWAAAAGLIMALGFATWSGFLFARLQTQGEMVADLTGEVQNLQQIIHLSEGTLAGNEQGLVHRVDLATSLNAEICALKPAGDSPSQPQARGLLWADRDSRSWVFSASQLERCPLGREYRIWFIGEDGSTSGGAFRVKDPDQRIEIQADELPPGTRAIKVTLEFPGKVGDQPGGELILYGDDARQIL